MNIDRIIYLVTIRLLYTSNEIVFLFIFFGPFLFPLSKLNSIGTIRIHILRIQVYIEEMKDVFFFFSFFL